MRTQLIILTIVLTCAILLSVTAFAGNPGQTKPTIKIGTFDSRVIALAYFRSAEYQLSMTELHKKYQQAKTDNNDSLMKVLEKEGPWTQIRMHQQVFSNAGASNIMSKIATSLPAIAREAGVGLIVFMQGKDLFGWGEGRSIGYLFLCVGLALSVLGVLLMRILRNRRLA